MFRNQGSGVFLLKKKKFLKKKKKKNLYAVATVPMVRLPIMRQQQQQQWQRCWAVGRGFAVHHLTHLPTKLLQLLLLLLLLLPVMLTMEASHVNIVSNAISKLTIRNILPQRN